MPIYNVYAAASVTLYKEIEAETEQEAIDKAGDLSVPTPTHSPYFCDDDETWETDGELGDFFDINCEEQSE